MGLRTAARRFTAGLGLMLLLASTSCRSSVGPTPVETDETFTGTLELGGVAFHTFTVNYTGSASDLSVTVQSLTPLSTITVGVGFGVPVATGCALGIVTTTAVGTEQIARNFAGPGTYCVQISDASNLVTEPTTYSLFVRHF